MIPRPKGFVSPLIPITGAIAGGSISPLLKKYYSVELVPLPNNLGKSEILIPLVVGGAGLVGALASKSETTATFLGALGGSALITGLLELIFSQPSTRARMTYTRPIAPIVRQRPYPQPQMQQRPILGRNITGRSTAGVPLRTVGCPTNFIQGSGKTVSAYSGRADSKTYIDPRVILA